MVFPKTYYMAWSEAFWSQFKIFFGSTIFLCVLLSLQFELRMPLLINWSRLSLKVRFRGPLGLETGASLSKSLALWPHVVSPA